MANNELEIGRGSGSWEWENNFDRLFIVRNAFSSVCDYRYSCFFLFYFLDESERNGKNPWVQDCYSTPERKDSVPSAVKTAGKYARVWSKAFKCSKKVKKKTLSFLEENKIKGKSANMIQFKSRDKARIKHDKARLRWSHAPFVRLDRPQRDRLRLLAFFFWQLHHGVRFWRRFHSKRRLDLNLFVMDECLLKEWSLVIACGGRGYQRILVVSG